MRDEEAEALRAARTTVRGFDLARGKAIVVLDVRPTQSHAADVCAVLGDAFGDISVIAAQDVARLVEPLSQWQTPVCFLAVLSVHSNSDAVARAAEQLRSAGLSCSVARIELPPMRSSCDELRRLEQLGVVSRTDFRHQAVVADRFFDLLGRRTPYNVTITHQHGRLTIRDTTPWFDLAGPLQDGEDRLLPGGEVAYTGACASGVMLANVGLLAVPQSAGHEAFQHLEQALRVENLALQIEAGCVVGISGGESARRAFATLSRYRRQPPRIVEVGIGLGPRSLAREEEWICPSNEALRGVHLGFGANPSGSNVTGASLHFDLVLGDCVLFVNDQLLPGFAESREHVRMP